mmetsp:Transcript_9403/g.13956  ORF Transcript_9403/g.13956 Transcript_9403/m.13956 type:complete len:246 (-) Transcript_9403:67-804(-)
MNILPTIVRHSSGVIASSLFRSFARTPDTHVRKSETRSGTLTNLSNKTSPSHPIMDTRASAERFPSEPIPTISQSRARYLARSSGDSFASSFSRSRFSASSLADSRSFSNNSLMFGIAARFRFPPSCFSPFDSSACDDFSSAAAVVAAVEALAQTNVGSASPFARDSRRLSFRNFFASLLVNSDGTSITLGLIFEDMDCQLESGTGFCFCLGLFFGGTTVVVVDVLLCCCFFFRDAIFCLDFFDI